MNLAADSLASTSIVNELRAAVRKMATISILAKVGVVEVETEALAFSLIGS